MTYSDIAIKDFVYGLVASSELASTISGRVYKDSRPMNSEVEDVSISVLSGDAAQLQQFILNVNVFVPDVNRGNEHIEDTKRLRTLCTKCLALFAEKVYADKLLRLDSQRVMKVNDADFHFINNRLYIRCCTE